MRYVVRSTGAWNRWRDEVRAGLRDPREPDALFRAAAFDANGLDRMDEGDFRLAAVWFEASAEQLLTAASRRGVA